MSNEATNNEDKFCEIIEYYMSYFDEVQSNENCGHFGNDEFYLYKARELARKYNFKKILNMLLYNCEDDNITAEEYKKDRDLKIKEYSELQRQKRQKEIDDLYRKRY